MKRFKDHIKQRDPVAKNLNKFNKAATHKDRKKADKQGYVKHKGDMQEAEGEYEGRKVTLNDPIRTSEDPNKKFKVYVKNDKGNVVVVRFGDPNLEIKRDNPKRLKSFRARHHCDTDPGPKWKARYWSCKMWEKGKKVSDLD